VKGDNEDQEAASTSCVAPCRPRSARSPTNAGVEGAIVVGKVLEERSDNFGYNAQTDEYVDLVKPASSTRPRSCAPRCRTQPRSLVC
jgi:chaperonin GroEL